MSDLSSRWQRDMRTLREFAANQHPHRRVFTTISGADLYGFPSDDGDYDLRGCHALPLRSLSDAMLTTAGMDKTPGLTVERMERDREPEMDFVSHDVGKLMRLALKANGYVLEQITSPLVVETSEWHREMNALVPRLTTRRLFHHYVGFFLNQERLYNSNDVKRVKGLLYQYRVALTGIHALKSGEFQANLVQLNEELKSPLIAELISRKQSAEGTTLDDDVPFLRDIARLEPALREAFELSPLPDEVTDETKAMVADFVWRCRSSVAA